MPINAYFCNVLGTRTSETDLWTFVYHANTWRWNVILRVCDYTSSQAGNLRTHFEHAQWRKSNTTIVSQFIRGRSSNVSRGPVRMWP